MRLFAAIELPESARRAVAARVEAARGELPAASWVRPENLHLTLVFFGEVEPERVDGLSAALAAASADSPRLTLRLGAPGAFPARGPVRLVWLALEPEQELRGLSGRLRAATAALGLSFDDKPFTSHVTLARCRRPWPESARARVAKLAPAEAIEFAVAAARLVASELAPDGSRYRTVSELALAEAS